MSDDAKQDDGSRDQVAHTEATNIRDDIKDREHDGFCPTCRTELEMGYGLAGGGMGVYAYCPQCGKIISKSEDRSGEFQRQTETDR